MINTEITSANTLLNRVIRFKHVHLPTKIYHDSVGSHTVDVWSRIKIFQENHPETTNMDWLYTRSLASHHDEREKFFGDRVAFDPRGVTQRRSQEIRRAVQWLKQPPEVADMVISYEETADILKGRAPLRPRRKEEILVATQDLISAADVFHLETVRNMHHPDYAHYFPLPTKPLIYAPRMLLNYFRRVSSLSTDETFVTHIRKDITDILHAIQGWWSVVPKSETPLALQVMLKSIVPNYIEPFITRRGEPVYNPK